MTELLTHEEYEAIAATMNFPSNAFIDGGFRPAADGKTFSSINPATGEVLAQIASCSAADVDIAVERARTAFEQGAWSRLHPSQRKEIMIRFVKLIKRNQIDLAVLESLESGKPIRDCVQIDLPETMHCLLWHAELADKLYGCVSPSGDDALGVISRESVGVAACVLPWNFPLMMLAWKIGPALAAGSSIIVKPAEQTSMSALRAAEIALEAGVPPGVFNVLPGLGEKAGAAIGIHPDIDAVSFTGSTEVGRKFLIYSAQSNLKKITLECGGKNSAIVLADIKNPDYVAAEIVRAAFWNMGQNCSANSRLIVDEKIKDDLLARIVARVGDWTTGAPLSPQNMLGAIVSADQHARILSYIETGKHEGARTVLEGAVNAPFVEPVIFDNITSDMTIAQEEIFGPVLAVISVKNVAEAVRIANDTRYGLQASLFTSDLSAAHRIARMLKAGTVTVNCYGEGDITTPFGGYKLSGFGGRDNAVHAHEQYSEVKTIWINLSDAEIDDSILSAIPPTD